MVSTMEQVRAHVAAVPVGGFVHTRDLVRGGSGSRGAVDVAMHRLKATEPLRVVRPGLFYKGRRTRFGVSAPDPMVAAYEVARAAGYDSGVGPAGYSAARFFSLTTQVPAHGVLAVPGRAPASTPWVRFVARSGHARRRLRCAEVAVLELLASWPRYSDEPWETFVARIREAVGQGVVDLDAVREVAYQERHVQARDLADRLREEVGQP